MRQKKSRISLIQIILLLIMIVCLGVFCYEMVWIPYQNQKQVEELKEEFPEDNGDSSEDRESTGKENGVQMVDLSALQELYPDVRGWLTIPGTNIDYPVLQSGEENPEYYLKRNYKGERDANGSLFLQWNCSAEDGPNRIIYGHNMNSGAMFGNLDQYEEAEFWETHKNVFFQTEKGMEEYIVVSVLKTDINKFPFTKVDFPDEAGLKEYVELAKSQEVFETGEDVAECHSVLTLVTCAYDWNGARTVVIAVK